MNGNNKNKTTLHKGRKSLFSGRTKHILILIPAILLLAGILTISLAAGQATALPASNIAIPLNANTMTTQSISSKSNTTLVGSNFTNPAIMDIHGNILMGGPSPDKEVFTNMTNYYQLIESNGTGYIGEGDIGPDTPDNNTLPLWTSDCIRVPNGNIYMDMYDSGEDKVYTALKFNYTHAQGYNTDGSPSGAPLDLALAGCVDGIVNLTALGIGPIVIPFHSIWWNESTTLESWGDWFAVGNPTSGVGGYINVTDTHFHIESEESILFQFLNSSMEVNGTSFIKGPVIITGPLNINGGTTMRGTGALDIPVGYMQTFGGMKISNGEIEYGSHMAITGKSIDISGSVMTAGSFSLTGTFLLGIPMNILGSMLTVGITGMGGLGTINGIMTVTGNILLPGLSVISGENVIIGSMTITPVGILINGIVGLLGLVQTSSTPSIGSSTILEINSGSLMGLPIPHVSVLANPLALVALGILGIGTVWVIFRSVYYGIKYRRTWPHRIREAVEGLGRRLSGVQLKSGKG